MVKIGNYSTLEVVKILDFGLYLDGGPFGEILLPTKYIPEGTSIGQDLEVFIYMDNEGRIIATTLRPYAIIGEIAYLRVKEIGEYGAFVDWGLHKDLFIPYREQHVEMEEGKSYLIKILLDEKTDRLIGSSRLDRYLEKVADGFEEGQLVSLLLATRTDMGYKAVVNGKYWGLIYGNEVFTDLKQGQAIDGYIKKIREDGKLDLSLQAQGYQQRIPLAAQQLLSLIKDHDGYLPLTDKSAPDDIYRLLNMSKKAFKKSLGLLYKQRMVSLEEKGIRLVES